MPEHWIDDVLPEHDPTDTFVATLRDDLQHGWRDGVPQVSTVRAAPAPKSHRRRHWAIAGAVAGVAAATVITVIVIADDDPGTITTGTTSGSSPDTTAVVETTPSPSTTALPASTTIDPSLGTAPLIGHLWVRVPTTDPWSIANELTLRFEPDGTVHGFDGCEEWTDDIIIDGATISYASGNAVLGYCGPQQRERLHTATFSVTEADGIARLTIGPAYDAPTTEYVAADTLPTVGEPAMVGSWSTMTGERLTLTADGSAALGGCAPGGTWRLERGDTVTIEGFVPDEAQACAGGGQFGPDRVFTTSLLDGGTLIAAAHVDGDRILLEGDTRLWLVPGPATEPALDLSRGTIHGFGAGTDGDSDFIVEAMSAIVGEPTFDSGWYVMPAVEVTDGEDCYGGRSARVVIWGDIAFGWLTLTDDATAIERLWITSVGDWSEFLDSARLEVVPPGGPSQITMTDDGLGAGSTVDDLLAAGVDVQNITDTQATISGPTYSFTLLNLDDRVVTSIVSQNPGFC